MNGETKDSLHQKNDYDNIETRIANRLKSIFAAFGQTINDFYLEAGIYFVGGFNAGLVAWDIYTHLASTGQPLAYAITMGFIAFVAVEGLAVYLVGAAAKTNNRWLWFFSVVFAAFFTFAHYREGQSKGIISHYIMLAIPFFVVIGYWARTLKIDAETGIADAATDHKIEMERRRQIEDEERHHKMELDRLKAEGQIAVKRLKAEGQIAGQKSGQSGQKSGHLDQMTRSNDPMNRANDTRSEVKMNRQNDLVDLVSIEPDLGPTELTRRLNDMGYDVSVSTVKRDIKSLNGTLSK